MRKWAAAIGSATPDPEKGSGAQLSVPPPVVGNKPAPGQRGPKGLAPRTTYSRVNTGAPPIPDAGGSAQKNAPPRGLEFLPAKVAHMSDQMMTRPSLNDLVKSAMVGTISKVDFSAEALRQQMNHGEDAGGEEKQASASPQHLPTDQLEKLADAVDYLANHFEKQADQGNVQKPGQGPGTLGVLEAQSSEKNIDAGQMGQATGANQPPKSPSTQSEQVQGGKANTGLETNDDMGHAEQPTEPISNEKGKIGPSGGDKTVTASALVQKNLERLQKVGQQQDPKPSSGIVSMIRKTAEDAINPAKISAGSSTPPEASASEQAVPSQPSDVNKQTSMVSSNDAAINYKKRQAKADPKSDVSDVLKEPPQSKATDKTLSQVLDNTESAGAKISSAQPNVAEGVMKTAAARALLSKLAEKANGGKPCPECGKTDCKCPAAGKGGGKKEKESMLNPTPQGHSGFSAGSMNPMSY